MRESVLILGGAGYIGQYLIEDLLKTQDFNIYIVDNFSTNTKFKRESIKKLNKHSGCEIFEVNVSKVNEYSKIIPSISYIYYLASHNSVSEAKTSPAKYIKQNILNLQLFLDGLVKFKTSNLKKLVLTSSRAVYGDAKNMYIKENSNLIPISIYGWSKLMQEVLLQNFCSTYDLSLDIYRIFNVYGRNQEKFYYDIGVVPMLFDQIVSKQCVTLLGNGKINRDYISIDNIISALVSSLDYSDSPRVEIYNLCTSVPISLNQIVESFQDIGYKFQINYKAETQGDTLTSVGNNKKLIQKIGKENLEDSILDFIHNYYRP